MGRRVDPLTVACPACRSAEGVGCVQVTELRDNAEGHMRVLGKDRRPHPSRVKLARMNMRPVGASDRRATTPR